MKGRGLRRAISRFALAPASARPIAALRVGISLVLLAQGLEALPAISTLYGDRGVLAEQAPAALQRIVTALAELGVGESHTLTGAGAVYMLALAALLVGHRTRVAAALAWGMHAVLLGGAAGERHRADELAQMALFYLMWMPSGAALSLDRLRDRARAGTTRTTDMTPGARLALRVLQVHLCVVQGSSGVEKACGEAWRNGEAIWRALMLPEYRRFDFSFLAAHPWIPVALGWSVLLYEMASPILVSMPRTRRASVFATSALHLGIALLMGLTTLSAVMIVLTLAAFAVPAEHDRRGRLPWQRGDGRRRIGRCENGWQRRWERCSSAIFGRTPRGTGSSSSPKGWTCSTWASPWRATTPMR